VSHAGSAEKPRAQGKPNAGFGYVAGKSQAAVAVMDSSYSRSGKTRMANFKCQLDVLC